jgi:hypothetical protein
MPRQPIYQFYAELDEYEPFIWRRFQVAGNLTMAQLAYVIMTMFEMKAGHLFAFELPQDEIAEGLANGMTPEFSKVYRFEILNEESYVEGDERCVILDAKEHTIFRNLSKLRERLGFNYDFGDNWWVFLTLEEVFIDKYVAGRELPRVLEGEGYGIIDDCGGVPGLQEVAQAFKKKKGKMYKELKDWLGIDNLDMSALNIEDMNFRLGRLPRIYADMYERSIVPTKRSLSLLERKYLKKQKA